MADSAVDRPSGTRWGRPTITRRLIALVAVPLMFTGGFAAWALITTSTEASRADTLRQLVATAASAGVLADQLQQERAAATAVLTGGQPFQQLETYVQRAAASDRAMAAYRRSRSELAPAPTGVEPLLKRIDDQVARLPALRDEVREAPTVALSAVTFAYRITIADLGALRDAVAQAEGGSAELVGRIRAVAALARATEFAARLQVDLYQTAAAGSALTPADQQAVLSVQAGYREAMSSFSDLAVPQWQDWLDHALTGADVLAVQRIQDQVSHAPIGTPLLLDRTQWMTATNAQISLLHEVERRIDTALSTEVDQLYVNKIRWLTAEATVVVLALVAAVVTAVRQSRRMIRRLRGLSAAAWATAFVSLPNTVAALRAIGTRTVDPEEFADQAAAPLPDTGGDEIADVSSAFLSVHRQAILTAADLANMRAGLSQILLHLARRNQRLVGVLMRELDGAERDEADPERLATLFRLDQLATRMGRYTDNLLVVGGQPAGRVGSADVPLETVLRGAQSKIERFQQAHIGLVDRRLFVRGDAVHDLMNLAAELLDNATQFSSPETAVDVACGYLDNEVLVRVSDHGVGIPPGRLAQLNATLAAPPAIDVSAIRSMGLTVVAHIAAQHGVRVRLYPIPTGGTIADVMLPAGLCWLHSGADGGPAPDRLPRSGPPIAAPPRRLEPVAGRGESTAPRGGFAWFLAAGSTTAGRRGAVDHRDPARVSASVAAFARGNAYSRSLHADPVPNVNRLEPR